MTSYIEKLKEKVLNLIENPIKSEGCEVADLVISTYRKSATVRVYVYCDQGVTLDRCAQLSRIVGDAIDGTDLFENGYTLEVSSPGLDRPLQKTIDYKYRIGELVKIQFAEANRPSIQAKIISVNDSNIVFESESGTFTESVANIERAKIVF
jgi:ribosome maturation factor RimP